VTGRLRSGGGALDPDAGTTTAELADVVARASGRMVPEQTLSAILELLTSTAAEVLPRVCGAGVTVVASDTGAVTTAATDDVVSAADGLQYALHEGPCLTAWAERSVVRVDDLTEEPRWPRWARAAAEQGLRSVLSAPLEAGDRAVGAIKVYSRDPGAFTAAHERTLAMFAAQAAALVDAAQTFRRAGELSDELQVALRRREIMSQATGIVMARERVPAAGAFAHLVAVGRRDGRSVHDVAERLVRAAEQGR
jgi:GAF domain-containing protein